jgi:hypothetical protein
MTAIAWAIVTGAFMIAASIEPAATEEGRQLGALFFLFLLGITFVCTIVEMRK